MSEERTWMKKCCGLCPYAKKDMLSLHPERAEDFAYTATNPFSDFPCHKTADYQEDSEFVDGGYVHGETSFTCHGFKTLQMAENATDEDYKREGFVPDGNGFDCPHDMIEAHTDAWESTRA